MPSNPRSIAVWFVALYAVLVAILIVLGALAEAPTPVWRLVALVIGAHLPYGVLLILACRYAIPGGTASLVYAALLLRVILVFAPPTFSDDVYRYVWDGRVTLAGHNPYDYPPDDPALANLRNGEWARINNPSLRTIYPPFAQAMFAAVAAVWPMAAGFKLTSALFDVLVVCAVIVIARDRQSRLSASGSLDRKREAMVAGVCYGLNPLVCIETGMSGHLEPAAILPMLFAVWVLTRDALDSRDLTRRWRRASDWLAPIVLGFGCATKLAPALIWPALARRARWWWIAVPATVFALYLPFTSAGAGMFESTGTFVRSWEGNAGLFAVAKSAAASIIGSIAGVVNTDEIVRIQWLDAPARMFQGTFVDLHQEGGFDPAAPGAFTLGDLALAAAKIVVGLGLVVVLVVAVKRRFNPARAGLWLFGALVLLSPVVHPWYVLWVLPFAAVEREWSWLVLGALLPLAYLPLDDWWARAEWSLPSWVPWIEYGAFFGALLLLYVKRRVTAR